MSLLVVLFIPLLVNAECKYQIMINSTIEFKNKIPNPCMYDPSTYDDTPAPIFGRINDVNEIEIRDRANYVNGQYTYTYHKAGSEGYNVDGWSVKLTDKDSTDPVTTKICTSVNGRPIIDMGWMFYRSKATSIDFSSFDTSEVLNMSNMFGESQVTTLDLSGFDTSKVTDMSGMFVYSQATELDLSGFDTNSVTSMVGMFGFSQIKTLDLSNFDTSKVTNMKNMFSNSHATTLDVGSFNTSNVTDMGSMFESSQAATLDLSSFDTSKVNNVYRMFYNANATTGYARTQADADMFNASSDKPSGLTFIVKGN